MDDADAADLTQQHGKANMIHLISLGAGVQSSTMALMAAKGEIGPMPTAAIFADTQAEPKAVMQWLDWLETQLPFPVYRVTAGSLKDESLSLRTSKDGEGSYVRNVVPAYTLNPDGTKGMLLRKCTADFKIAPLARKQRELMKAAGQKTLTSWIGISLDEAHRMKPSRVKYAQHRWPLLEMGMTRFHCLEWMKKNGYPQPPKSACTFCPYHSDAQWNELKKTDAESFADAVKFEREWNEVVLTDKRPSQTKGRIYLHRSCVPLDQVDFRSAEDAGQMSMFGNECEGMCGV
jgi:hypothetical protein